MTRTRAAVVGTGSDPDNPSAEGFAMAYKHADGFEAIDGCEVVACADLVAENREAFARHYGIDDEHVYADAGDLARGADPDVVSVCVPPAAHADVVLALADAGVPAVHCEKPMALTYGEARLMTETCERYGTTLTFNHQRRFGEPFRRAKALLDDGAVGALERVEFAAPNLYDYGSHSFDLSGYFVDETPAAWVLANVDYRTENRWFGAHNENQAIAHWEYRDGVHGLAATGQHGGEGQALVGAHNRLVGTAGVVEVGPHDAEADLRVRQDGTWEAVDTGDEGLHGPGYVERAVRDVVRALREGGESELSAGNALNATELSFGAWESARRRGRVEFPLAVDDNPLEAMVESGALRPAPDEE